ncbi:SDR family NAD(P)-dependent oxidoreductase [Sphingomonas sp. ac-8]|uniref:SDR family NAD(P)-dependent oxidoreductase n=1 Tax=Sphingomonas sp. ac-8 TaxID=3242977 RepID=UPI003A80782A
MPPSPDMGAAILQSLLFPPVSVDRRALARALEGKTVLVTGASAGIGEQVARLVAASGARVLLVARNAARLEALAAEIGARSGSAQAFATDLNDPAQVERLASQLPALAPDILVSNAGKSIRRPLFDALDRFHDIGRTNGVNYLAPARLVLAAAPGLVARGGQVINVSAANVLLPPAPYWGPYQASKSAFDQWLRCAAPELRARGVAVSSLYLPLVRTAMIAPTAIYDRVPAMSAEQAAVRIVAAMLSRRRRWMPWWLPPARMAAALGGRAWEAWLDRQQRAALR